MKYTNELSISQICEANELNEIRATYLTKKKPTKQITSSRDCFHAVYGTYEQIELFEEFKIILLNRANKIMGFYTVSKGGISGTVVDCKLVFSVALSVGASSIILSHNHPSGNLEPSSADLELTKKIVNAGKVLDIFVLDHVIVTDEGYYSFVDEGKM